ncbi:MAG: hypothetical protein ACK5AZ_24555 [Bryobacteraceae bacterium]
MSGATIGALIGTALAKIIGPITLFSVDAGLFAKNYKTLSLTTGAGVMADALLAVFFLPHGLTMSALLVAVIVAFGISVPIFEIRRRTAKKRG